VHFDHGISFYDAVSYNHSQYQDNYASGSSVVQTAGKTVPGAPAWMNKFVATATVGGVEVQLIGDFVGKRYATYTNDLHVASYFLMGLNLSGKLPYMGSLLKNPRWNFNVANLANRQGTLEVVVGAASGTYNTYPIAPRQGFLTLKADFS
jgi:iron complex outermembrane receptor protein